MLPETWKQFREILTDQANINKIPISGQFELTARCNLHCKMCYVCLSETDKDIISRELTAAEWINLAKECQKEGMLYLLLTGGEVFIRPDFREIYEELLKMGLRITIYTNASLVTPEIAKWLGRIPPASMEVSIYGASPQTYQKVTGNPDAFGRTLQGIDLLLAEGINLSLRTTVIQANAIDHDKLVELAEIRNLLLRYGFYISPRRGIYTGIKDDIRLSPYDIAQYEFHARRTYTRVVERMKEKYRIPKETELIDKSEQKNNSVSPDYPFKCDAGKSLFWVTWYGSMTPCAIMEEPAVKPLKIGFANAWKELISLCESIPSCSECSQCLIKDVCWTCPARLKSENGSYEIPAPYLCEWAKLRNNYLNSEKD